MTSRVEIGSTIAQGDAVATPWDAIVLGAGVAGCAAAFHLASRGLKVLIVEAKRFPRDKVCGGCLNTRAQQSLTRIGWFPKNLPGDVPSIERLCIHVRGRRTLWRVPTMISVRRSTLDESLLRRAIDAGAQCLMETRGQVIADTSNHPANDREGSCEVALTPSHGRRSSEDTFRATAACVIVATGLTRSALSRDTRWEMDIAHDSRIGCHALVPRNSLVGEDLPLEGILHMVVGRIGYVGICETDGGLIDLAAALDPSAVRELGGIETCIDRLLEDAGIHWCTDAPRPSWDGTPWLTRVTNPVASHGVFLVGDALGYIEPFTGEGMSWALQGAEVLAEFLSQNTSSSNMWAEKAWTQWVQNHRRWNQRVAKWVSRQARHPRRAYQVLRILDWLPPLRKMLVRKAMQ